MRDPNRIDIILEEIKNIWKEHPDLRLGQLLLNAVPETYLYYIEDDKLIEYLKNIFSKE